MKVSCTTSSRFAGIGAHDLATWVAGGRGQVACLTLRLAADLGTMDVHLSRVGPLFFFAQLENQTPTINKNHSGKLEIIERTPIILVEDFSPCAA